jgi:hypothetical protein
LPSPFPVSVARTAPLEARTTETDESRSLQEGYCLASAVRPSEKEPEQETPM